MASSSKRSFPFLKVETTPPSKKSKTQLSQSKTDIFNLKKSPSISKQEERKTTPSTTKNSYVPLAEKMRPAKLSHYIGQTHLVGPKTLVYDLLQNGQIPSMILWGPPGCGKTSLINVIIKECSKLSDQPIKCIKLSATSAGINDVRQAVKEAETQKKLGHKTVVFMDEIHRFNKLQQDIFLPHVEGGTFILIGATTENPSSGLNSALLSRCRVFILKKLEKEEVNSILSKAIHTLEGEIISKNNQKSNKKFFIDQELVEWLSEVCDGDARVALGALEISVQSILTKSSQSQKLDMNDIKNSLMKTQTLTDKKSNNVYYLYSAMHHSILGNDDNAALYWLARIMATREDPVYIGRKLVAIASQEISINDEDALTTAVHTMHSCQMIGMPECDVMLAQCVIYLARAEKSREVLNAFKKCQAAVTNHIGPQPKVPLFIKDRSGEGKLRASLGRNYKNLVRQENLKKSYLPEGLDKTNFFD